MHGEDDVEDAGDEGEDEGGLIAAAVAVGSEELEAEGDDDEGADHHDDGAGEEGVTVAGVLAGRPVFSPAVGELDEDEQLRDEEEDGHDETAPREEDEEAVGDDEGDEHDSDGSDDLPKDAAVIEFDFALGLEAEIVMVRGDVVDEVEEEQREGDAINSLSPETLRKGILTVTNGAVVSHLLLDCPLEEPSDSVVV